MPVCHAQENVLQRVMQLPVVSSTCESLQRTYASTKEAHPLMASVCEVYERGVQGASALAMWSVEPVVRRLEPQCESIHRWGHGRREPTRASLGGTVRALACAEHSPGAFLTNPPHAFAQGSRCG